MITESRLRAIRDGLGISREKLAYRTGGNVCVTTIRNLERGRNRVTVSKAQQILSAINTLLIEAQKPVVTLDDLEIRLY